MQVRDVMTTEVVTLSPDASLAEAARQLIDSAVSGGPVIDSMGRLVGMITEADFLAKALHRRVGRLKRVPFAEIHRQGSLVTAATVAEVMSTDVVTIHPGASIGEAGRRMTNGRVRRLPVVDAAGAVVGIVSRSDVLKVFARSDASIEADIDGLLSGPLAVAGRDVTIDVDDGVVILRGKADTRAERSLIEHLIGSCDGVVRVDGELDLNVDEALADTRWAGYAQEGVER